MSYKMLDAYSRRPSEDDRRGTESRDRRRNSYPTRGPELYKDDRNLSDFPSDPPPPAGTKSDSTTNPSQPDLGARASSTSLSLTGSSGVDRDNVHEKLVKLWKRQANAITEVARIKAERDPLEKVLKTRQAEYDKSMARLADFPSVPELQNMHRRKYDDQVQQLDRRLQKALDEVDVTTEAFASIFSRLPCAHCKQSDTKSAAKASVGGDQEALGKQQAEINDLKKQLCQVEAQRCKEQEDLRRIKGEMDEMRKMLKRETKGQEAIKRMKGEIAQMMEEVRKEMTREMQKEIRELKEGVKGTKQEVSEEVHEQLGVIRKEFEERQTEKAESKQRSSGLRSDIDGLLKRVDELTARLSQETVSTASLGENLANQSLRLDVQARKVEEHEAKLSNIDVDALEGVAETMSFEFPNLQRKVDGLQSSMDDLGKRIESKHAEVYDKAREYVTKGMNEIAGIVDGLQSATQSHAARIKALEQTSRGSDGGSTVVARSASAEADTSDAGMASTETDKLAQDYTSLRAALDQVQCQLASLAKDTRSLDDQLALQRHTVDVLNSRINNMTTKTMAEHIIGHLELVYPTALELLPDLSRLRGFVDAMNGRLEKAEDDLRDYKRKAERFEDTIGTLLPGSRENQPRTPDFLGNGVGHKRRRLDSSPSGTEYPISNGAG